MLRKSSLAMLLILTPLQAFSFDIKPGLWERTTSNEVEEMPDYSSGERTVEVCLSEESTENMEKFIITGANESGATDISVAQNDDTMLLKATFATPSGEAIDIEATLTRHNSEHYSSLTRAFNYQTFVTRQENHWIGEDC